MALNYSKKKNLIRSPDEYTRYYGDLRGVDFSSDHTNVHDQRLAYSINMYKDYRAGEGNAIETIPGFRRRFQAPRAITRDGTTYEKINGIHEFNFVTEDGKRDKDIIVHLGKYLYLWDNYPESVNVVQRHNIYIPTDSLIIDIDFPCSEILAVNCGTSKYTSGMTFSAQNKQLTLPSFFERYQGQYAMLEYYESTREPSNAIYSDMSDNESKSFIFNNCLYILDGTNYLMYNNGKVNKVSSSSVYVPTTYINIPVGSVSPTDITKHEYEQKNLLSNFYRHTYIAGVTKNDEGEEIGITEYPLYDNDYSAITVKVYGNELTDGYEIDSANGVIKFTTAPEPPSKVNKPETYAGVEIIYKKSSTSIARDSGMINNCTVVATFDKRVFLTGNPKYPNRIWYCGYNNTTGYEDATYFGELDYVDDGVENAPITGLIPVADTLAAIKNHAHQDSSVYFHTRFETSEGIIPVSYPSEPGLNGIGCLGACINFLDDPIFISRLGVEAIGQLSVRLERAIEHRSSLIDAKLVNLDLSKARLTEWNGYLVVLASDGKVFLADSRQRYTHDSGVMQYEWYYLEGIGVYEEQVPEYYYAPAKYLSLPDKVTYDGEEYEVDIATHIYNRSSIRSENLLHTAVKQIEENEEFVAFDDGYGTYYILKPTWDGKSIDQFGDPIVEIKAIVCERRGSYTGGIFYPANKIVCIDDNIFFGTDNGVVCSFNFDKRNNDGTISPTWYSFDERTIYCGIATKMDNCGVPHLAKSTIKKSTVIKTKSMKVSSAKVKIRTNKKGYESLTRINNRIFDFDDIDFSDFSFASSDQSIFAIKEKEKHWVEKQHWIYSDEYQRPFSVNYLAFRYKISGRIKG